MPEADQSNTYHTVPEVARHRLPCPVCGGQVVNRSKLDGGPYCIENMSHMGGLVLTDEPVARRLVDDIQTLADFWPELWAVPWGGLARCLEAMGWRHQDPTGTPTTNRIGAHD